MKVKTIGNTKTGFNVLIYVAKKWRAFATLWSPKSEGFSNFSSYRNAKQAAEKVADDFGIKLEWEG